MLYKLDNACPDKNKNWFIRANNCSEQDQNIAIFTKDKDTSEQPIHDNMELMTKDKVQEMFNFKELSFTDHAMVNKKIDSAKM